MTPGDLIAAACVLVVVLVVGRALYLDKRRRHERNQLGIGGRGVRR